jgi:hypothetical protein
MARRYTSPYLDLRDAVPLIIERLGLMTDDREAPTGPLRDASTQLIAVLRDGVIQAEGQLSVVANDVQSSVIAQHPVQPITTDWWIGVGHDVEIDWIASGMMRKIGHRFEIMRSIRIKQADLDRVWPPSELRQESDINREATAGQESAATKRLADQLKTDPQMTRANALQWCTASGYRLSKRGFERVWPAARQLAELPRIAKAGRKPKSSR